jgi:hypothetical protein
VTLDQVQGIIGAHNLGGLYSLSPLPHVSGDSAIETVRLDSHGPRVQR